MSTFCYDVFISYASEDRAWAEERVLKPLQRCRTADGRVPKIFFDREREGLQVGEEWQGALAKAIQDSQKFVPIYSRNYFSKQPCIWELNIANGLDLARKERKLNPILLDVTASRDVPSEVRSAQFVSVDVHDWLARLCHAIGFEPAKEVLTLRFKSHLPAMLVVNNTLPPVEVEVFSDAHGHGPNVEVNLSAKKGGLRGDLTVISRNGVAEFSDLSFSEPHDKPMSIFASADGCVSASSSAFRVLPPPAPVIPLGRSIDVFGDPFFFPNGQALAVLVSGRLSVWNTEGKQVGESLPIDAPIRFIVRDEGFIAIADWTGHIWIVAQNGQAYEWDFSSQNEKLAVPGGIALIGGCAYVGFWNGNVYRLQPGSEAELLWQHPLGVQALSTVGKRIAIVDLAGKLLLWESGVSISAVETGESCIHNMKTVGDNVILVGERHLLKYLPQSKSLLREPLHLATIHATLADISCPIVCDVQGRGFRFDAGLTPKKRFQIPAGAFPVSADHVGVWAVCRLAEGAHILLRGHQVVHTHAGPLAVSPDGQHFALGENDALRLLDPVVIETLIEREKNG
jgi:hypothetical protein